MSDSGTAPRGGTLATGTTAPGGVDANGGSQASGGGRSSNGGTTAGGTMPAVSVNTMGGSAATADHQTRGGSSAVGTTALGGNSATGEATGTGTCTVSSPSDTPVGYAANVTGGGKATPTDVESMAALVAALTAYKKGTSGLVLRYTGKFDFSSIADPCTQFEKSVQTVDIKDVSNLTILGASGSSANFGLHLSRVSNVIIRNMTIGLLPGGGSSDAIGIEGESSQIWIDHNELFSSMLECKGAGDSEFDGLLDIKDGSHHMTFSYNYFHDHHKVGLMGSSDSDLAERSITLHHNRYENVGSRTPLQRGGPTHIYNNYYNRVAVSGINVRMGGQALIESNYFENCNNPVTSRDSDQIGYWELRNNFVGGGITWSETDQPFANATDWKTTQTLKTALGYTYTPDPAACVKATVLAHAGARL